MINTVNITRAYSEVYEFINALGEEYIQKIPKRVFETIKNNRDINYSPNFNANIPLKEGQISHEALALIAALNLEYWCQSEEEKKELKQIYVNNSKKEEEKYSYENIFKKEEKIEEVVSENELEVQENLQMIEYKEESILKRIINKIKEFFRIGK